ncbi:Efflux pump dep3 [Microsporum ferrugineum]
MDIEKLEAEKTVAGDSGSGNSNNNPSSGHAHGDPSPRQIRGWKWAVVYASILSTTFLFSLDNTIVADIQPAILELFGQVQLLPWIGVGFALGTMCVLPWGKVYGVFNAKWVYLFNIVLFELGSAVCGSAPNIAVLILGRVIAGVGGAGMYSGTLSFVAILTTIKERPIYMAGSTVVWGLGSVLGPIVGGAFAQSSASWRWAFYINLPIGAAFLPAYLFLIPSVDPQPSKSFKEKCKMIDWIMTTIFLGGSACLIMAITLGGVVYSWNSASTIVLWAMSAVLLIVSILVAKFHPGVSRENRLYPVHFLNRPILINLQIQMFLVSGIALATTYYIPLYFQFLHGDGPLQAGVRLLPFIISLVVVSMINGTFMPALPYAMPWYTAGSALVVIDTVNLDTSNAKIYGYTILVGAGTGCYVVAGFAIVQSLVSPKDIPNAVGAMAISQDLGMVVFLSLAGSIYQNLSLKEVARALPSASKSELTDLIAGTSSRSFKALSQADKDAVIPYITGPMRNVWLFFLVAAILSFLLSAMLGVRLNPSCTPYYILLYWDN